MRIAMILLSIVALVFIGSISWSLLDSKNTWMGQKQITEIGTNGTDIEALRHQIKTEEKLKELELIVKELSKKNGNTSTTGEQQDTTEKPTEEIVKLSGKFLAKVMPTATLTQVKNKGIYGLYTFDSNTLYSTYEDPKLGLTVVASSLDYTTFMRNMKALWKEVFTVNETKSFPGKSFYLNPPKPDTSVRIVLEYETQSIALEISKSKFPILKSLLLKK